MSRHRRSTVATLIAGGCLLVSTVGVATTTVSASGPSPDANAADYSPAIVAGVAATYDISKGQAARRLDREREQRDLLAKLGEQGLVRQGAFLDADGSLIVNAPKTDSATTALRGELRA